MCRFPQHETNALDGMRVCVSACMRVCACARVCMYVCVCGVCLHACVCVRACMCGVRVCVCVCVCMCVCVHARVYYNLKLCLWYHGVV